MSFWTRKTRIGAAEFAVQILTLAKGEDASKSPLLRDSHVALAVFNEELFHLRIFGLEYALVNNLNTSTREKVLGAHMAHLEYASAQAGGDGETFRRELSRRREAYWDALKVPHERGPAWQVAKAFSALCGAEMDYKVTMQGFTEFAGTIKAVSDVLKSVTIV